jgi:hypothetical protein
MIINRSPYSVLRSSPRIILGHLVRGDVVLERRDEEELVLTTLSRYTSRAAILDVLACGLASVAAKDPVAGARVLQCGLPWLTVLSGPDRATAVMEMLDELEDGAKSGSWTEFIQVIIEWEEMAELEAALGDTGPEENEEFVAGEPGVAKHVKRVEKLEKLHRELAEVVDLKGPFVGSLHERKKAAKKLRQKIAKLQAKS